MTRLRTAAALAVAGALSVTALQAPASAGAAEQPRPTAANGKGRVDDRPGPLTRKQRALERAALEKVVRGQATVQQRGPSTVVRMGRGEYVELARETTDKVFVILAEFGNQKKYGGEDGPLHNQIPEPDRNVDNTTSWQRDYSPDFYQRLFFSEAAGDVSGANYFIAQSSGRYSVTGQVGDWVRLPYNEARYGNNDNEADGYWNFVNDAVDAWYADQVARGRTAEQIAADLAQYDVYDRYDYDGDGNFNEADGYIDRIQIVHAGQGEETGGGAQGPDAIWSHRWYAFGSDYGKTGPDYNKAGGARIGESAIWVGDYSTIPENANVGVLAHEFAHDLGVPDEYDQTYTGESPTGFWSLMASGSYGGTGGNELGDMPTDLSGYAKLALGWLNYTVVDPRKRSTTTLGVAEYNTRQKQALIVRLPKKDRTTTINTPYAGSMEWWSGSGDDLNNTLTRQLDLPVTTPAAASMKAWYDIEAGYDYLYAEVSGDGGQNWTALPGTVNGTAIGTDGSGAPALDGSSGGAWVDLSYPLDGYAGQSVLFRFRYRTDGGVALKGFTFDNLAVTAGGTTVFADDAETEQPGWTAAGFSRTTGSITQAYSQYYIAENRQYVSYDRSLRTGPYNFGFLPDRPNWVEHFPYQNGLLISLWDTFYRNNQTGVHPGEGLILPIDANPVPERWADGTPMRTRLQVYDATFGLERTDAVTLNKGGVPTTIRAKPAVPVFDDRRTYWYASKPDAGVKVPNTGTRIEVLSQTPDGRLMDVRVSQRRR